MFRIVVVLMFGALPVFAASEGGFGAIGSSGFHGPQALCNQCHYGGATPSVQLTGPAVVEVSGLSRFRLAVTGGAGKVAGFNAQVTDVGRTANHGAVLLPDPGQHQVVSSPSEVVHSKPQLFANGSASFEFTLVAPNRPMRLVLYAAGNSCNGDRTTSGDASAGTKLEIEVVPVGADAGLDAGAPDAGTVADAGWALDAGRVADGGSILDAGAPEPVQPSHDAGAAEGTERSGGGCSATGAASPWLLAVGLVVSMVGRSNRRRSSKARS